jgi:hypothetical protein
MRPASFVLLLVVPVVACSTEPDTRIEAAQVTWMEWPAEVLTATPFTVRLVGYSVSCVEVVKFVTEPTVDQSAVTFEPYFLLTGQPGYCRLDVAGAPRVDTASIRIIAQFFDTRAAVRGLEAQIPRTYEIRAGTDVSTPERLTGMGLPVRTFGEVTVRSAQVATERINAGGRAYASRDSLGCVTLSAFGVYPGYVIENPPADTAPYWSGFVRGYIYAPAAPVCGESKVFHLVTRD